jgi:hypothetical protein
MLFCQNDHKMLETAIAILSVQRDPTPITRGRRLLLKRLWVNEKSISTRSRPKRKLHSGSLRLKIFGKYKYRLNGGEKDEEINHYYFGARYYASRLGS